jgi:type IV secretory pathway VirB6-like protein
MAQSGAHGNMDISDQKATFHGFLMASVWGCGLTAQLVGLLTLAFAIGAGWWAGFVALVLIGVAIGTTFKLSGVYWAVQVALWVLLAIGGLLIPLLTAG